MIGKTCAMPSLAALLLCLSNTARHLRPNFISPPRRPLPTSAHSSKSNSFPTTNMITHLLALLIGFVAGALVMRKHKAKADTLEAKGRQALDALKGK